MPEQLQPTHKENHYRIWSFEHTAWWRPNRLGYTEHVREAGWYDEDEAQSIVINAMGNEMAIANDPDDVPAVLLAGSHNF